MGIVAAGDSMRLGRVQRSLVPALILLVLACLAPAQAASISLLCGVAASWPVESCHAAATRFETATGHEVEVIEAPADPDETLALLSQLFAVKSNAIDVVQLDIIWPGILASHLQDLGAEGWRLADEQAEPARRAGIVRARLVALPLHVDVGVLFYRRDLLEAYGAAGPVQWADLHRTAGRILGAEREAGRAIDGYLFQGRAYEGLTCNLLEWMVATGAGPLLVDGQIHVNRPAFKAMLSDAASWIGATAPRSNLQASEAETFARFADGKALFMRHWASNASRLAREAPEVAAATAMAPLPAAPRGRHAGTLGGGMVGVSAYSSAPDAAHALALHLASREEQRRRATADGLIPAARALLKDAELQAELPALATLATAIDDAVVRPAQEIGRSYIWLSRELASTVHAILAGDISAGEGLDALQRRLERMSGGGGRW